ncbi:MAG: c-type cytochrome biogenesis protein CcmI [Alphaproteobacteria bacterium]|nr:c-type cytochrome biogenesis protein CcmI [Alphaproteobacteria bacterium]
MIWLAVLLLAAVVMAPLGWSLARTAAPRGRREAALALHRAQLAELDRDLAEGRIPRLDHATAVLEVQRRMLAVAEDRDAAPLRTAATPLRIALILVPLTGLALYLVGGLPGLPSMPADARIAGMRERARKEAQLIPILRERLKSMDPHAEATRQGYVLLGGAEAGRQDMDRAAEAWRHALAIRFDPTLAAETAEAITESAGHVTEEAAGLFRRALAEAPPDAPWRSVAEKRLGGPR